MTEGTNGVPCPLHPFLCSAASAYYFHFQHLDLVYVLRKCECECGCGKGGSFTSVTFVQTRFQLVVELLVLMKDANKLGYHQYKVVLQFERKILSDVPVRYYGNLVLTMQGND